MEEPDGICHSQRVCQSQQGSLNEDPYNIEAERLAMEECMRGTDVRNTWSEQEMVCNFAGAMRPGTPDGMFDDHSGSLTCVQVVRVPLVANMDLDTMAHTLYQTVLTKILKSIIWLKSTQTRAHEFTIFCWLPKCAFLEVTRHHCHRSNRSLARVETIVKHIGAQRIGDQLPCAWRCRSLMQRVRSLGWPFRLWLASPSNPESIFPHQFAKHHVHHAEGEMMNEANLSSFSYDDFESDSEDGEWDVFCFENDDDEPEQPAEDDNASDVSEDDDWQEFGRRAHHYFEVMFGLQASVQTHFHSCISKIYVQRSRDRPPTAISPKELGSAKDAQKAWWGLERRIDVGSIGGSPSASQHRVRLLALGDDWVPKACARCWWVSI